MLITTSPLWHALSPKQNDMNDINFYDLPLWAYIPATIWGLLVAFLTLNILVKTNLRTWAVILITIGAFVTYFFCALYITMILIR